LGPGAAIGECQAVKPELGGKQVCPNCGAKFYDLRRRPATCPKCATVFDPADESLKLKRTPRVRTAPYTPDYDDAETRKEKTRRTAAAADDDEAPEDEEDDEDADVEETAELDSEDSGADAGALAEDEDEEGADGDALPPGFSEAEEDAEIEDAVDEDDGVPLLEEDEGFEEGDIEVADDAESEEER
jgi:uncharacterized protein (TIGR02300 family)